MQKESPRIGERGNSWDTIFLSPLAFSLSNPTFFSNILAWRHVLSWDLRVGPIKERKYSTDLEQRHFFRVYTKVLLKKKKTSSQARGYERKGSPSLKFKQNKNKHFKKPNKISNSAGLKSSQVLPHLKGWARWSDSFLSLKPLHWEIYICARCKVM